MIHIQPDRGKTATGRARKPAWLMAVFFKLLIFNKNKVG